MDRATGIFNTLLSRASRIPRNFIIDQTNVYKNARKCKLKPFANYKKIAVVIVPTPEELKLRGEKQFKEMGKEVPAEAVNEMLGPRPNPQGSYHYGLVNTTRTIRLASSAPIINGKQRYAVNSASFIPADTPLKLADYFKIPGVFNLGSISDNPTGGGGYLQTSVMAAYYRTFVEVVFENPEDVVQSWHIDGHIFFVVGMDGGQWTTASRLNYNLRDGISRCTIQVYPKSWTALYMPLDNVGMWNIRSENWARQYLGQQLYLRVYSPANSWRDEYPIPKNALLCGRASGRSTRPL